MAAARKIVPLPCSLTLVLLTIGIIMNHLLAQEPVQPALEQLSGNPRSSARFSAHAILKALERFGTDLLGELTGVAPTIFSKGIALVTAAKIIRDITHSAALYDHPACRVYWSLIDDFFEGEENDIHFFFLFKNSFLCCDLDLTPRPIFFLLFSFVF